MYRSSSFYGRLPFSSEPSLPPSFSSSAPRSMCKQRWASVSAFSDKGWQPSDCSVPPLFPADRWGMAWLSLWRPEPEAAYTCTLSLSLSLPPTPQPPRCHPSSHVNTLTEVSSHAKQTHAARWTDRQSHRYKHRLEDTFSPGMCQVINLFRRSWIENSSIFLFWSTKKY